MTYKTYCEIKCIRIINSSFKIIAIEIKEQFSAFHSDITSSDTQGSIVVPIVFNLFYVIFSMSMEIINPFESITPFLYPLKTSENLTVFLCFQGEEKGGSSRQEVFCEKGVLRNFTKFTRKHLCRSLFFNKVAGLRRRCFPVNFVKFLRTPFLTEHLQWLLLYDQDYGEYFICSYEFFGRFRVEDAGWQMQDGGYYIFQIELGINNLM